MHIIVTLEGGQLPKPKNRVLSLARPPPQLHCSQGQAHTKQTVNASVLEVSEPPPTQLNEQQPTTSLPVPSSGNQAACGSPTPALESLTHTHSKSTEHNEVSWCCSSRWPNGTVRMALSEQNTHRSIFSQPAHHSPLDAHRYRSPPRTAAEVLLLPPRHCCAVRMQQRGSGAVQQQPAAAAATTAAKPCMASLTEHSARHMAGAHKRTTRSQHSPAQAAAP